MPGDIILSKCTKNHGHMPYSSWDMAHDLCNFYFSFWAIFCPFTLLTAQKIKMSKNENKDAWRYHFTNVYQKLWLDDVRFLRYGVLQMDGQTDGRTNGRKSWHMEVGAPCKKYETLFVKWCRSSFHVLDNPVLFEIFDWF